MKINSLDIYISAEEINNAVENAVANAPADAPKLDDLKLILKDGSLVFAGAFPSPVPLMKSIPLKLEVKPLVDSNTETISFELKLLGTGDMISGMIMKFLDSKLAALPITREGNRLIPDIPELMKLKNIDGDIKVKRFDINEQGISIHIAGNFQMPQPNSGIMPY